MIRLIVAHDLNHCIGKDGNIPWKQKTDLKRFRALTMGLPCIMGRKTYESIGKYLSGRKNCIISKTVDTIDNCEVYPRIEDAIRENPNCFIIGGGEIYRQTINIADTLHITVVHTTIEEGDTFFPKIDLTKWKPFWRIEYKKDMDNDFDFDFIDYVRK